jgi:hypothetical protein
VTYYLIGINNTNMNDADSFAFVVILWVIGAIIFAVQAGNTAPDGWHYGGPPDHSNLDPPKDFSKPKSDTRYEYYEPKQIKDDNGYYTDDYSSLFTRCDYVPRKTS